MPQEDSHRGERDVVPAEALDTAPTAVNALDYVSTALRGKLEAAELGDLGVVTVVTIAILQLVSNPAKVKLYVTQAVRTITLEFDVDDKDKGKIIGKGGHTIDAIRSLARSVAGESDKSFKISLIEDQPVASEPRRAYRQEGNRRYNRRYDY